MRERYRWYLPATADELNEIWARGILTVDANVLLDLYRYHESTREALIGAIEQWRGELWLTAQVAEEFFRNRGTAMRATNKTFDDALEIVSGLKLSVDKLRALKLIASPIVDEVEASISQVIDKASADITDSQREHQAYLRGDPIIERLLQLFEGRLGPEPSEDRRAELIREADRRIKAEIPPGYKDAKKAGDGPYGDFIFWRQALDYSRDQALPLVIVTSDAKEDWWDQHSGRTFGPRPELLREGFKETGSRVLIYQTLSFLQANESRGGAVVTPASEQELMALASLRAAEASYDAAKVAAIEALEPRHIALLKALEAKEQQLENMQNWRQTLAASHPGRSPLPDQTDEQFGQMWTDFAVNQEQQLREVDDDLRKLNDERALLIRQSSEIEQQMISVIHRPS